MEVISAKVIPKFGYYQVNISCRNVLLKTIYSENSVARKVFSYNIKDSPTLWYPVRLARLHLAYVCIATWLQGLALKCSFEIHVPTLQCLHIFDKTFGISKLENVCLVKITQGNFLFQKSAYQAHTAVDPILLSRLEESTAVCIGQVITEKPWALCSFQLLRVMGISTWHTQNNVHCCILSFCN